MAWPEFVQRGYISKLLKPFRSRLTPYTIQSMDQPKKLALVTSCGVHLKSDSPFDMESGEGDPTFRHFATTAKAEDLMVTHTHYENSGVLADFDIALPRQDILSRVDRGEIGSLHDTCYSFVGFFHDIERFLDVECLKVAQDFQKAGVDAVLLTPC